MNKMTPTLAAFAVLLSVAGCSKPQVAAPAENQESAPIATAADLNNAQRAYLLANQRMHKDMAANIDADADVAFMQGMIPHHQGAVDMARVVLEHGKDPETRKLAETVIKTQTAEIAAMEAWMVKHGQMRDGHKVEPGEPKSGDAVDHSKMGH